MAPKYLNSYAKMIIFQKNVFLLIFLHFFCKFLSKLRFLVAFFYPSDAKKKKNILVFFFFFFFWNSGTQNIQIAPLALGSAVGVATHCYLPVFHGGAPQQFLKILKKHTKIEGLDACKKIKHCKKNKIPPAKK